MKEGGRPSPDFAPDRKSGTPPEGAMKGAEGLTRRELLRRATRSVVGAAASASITSKDVLGKVTRGSEKDGESGADTIGRFIQAENQRALDTFVATARGNLRTAAVREALMGRGRNPLGVIIRAIEVPLDPAQVEGNVYDVRDLFQYPVQLNPYFLGNGVFINDRQTMLTAAHVVHGESRKQYPVDGVDAMVLHNIHAQHDRRVLSRDLSLSDDDVHAHLVSTIGVDPDGDGSGKNINLHKAYLGMAIKVNPGLAHLFSRDSAAAKIIANSFMFILPPGESRPPSVEVSEPYGEDERGQSLRRASGMSGSPTFVFIEGRYVFGGVFWGVNTLTDNVRHRVISVGFFHGPDALKRVIEER